MRIVLLPVVAISGSGTVGSPGPPVSTNPAVLGDLVVGPFLQWFDTKLLGRPFFQRVELDVTLPTGQYDKKYLINPGSNLWTIEPYYAFTWFLTPEFSTSWRIHYTYNTKNDDPFAAPGGQRRPARAGVPLQLLVRIRVLQELPRRRGGVLPEADHRG